MLEEAKQIGLSANEEEIDAQRKHEEEMAKLLRQKQLKEEAQKRAADLERRRNKQKEKIIEEDKKKNEIENEIRRLQLEAEEKRKAELNEKRRMKYQNLLMHSWDYNFQKIWSSSLEHRSDFELNLTYGFRLFRHMGVFLSEAASTIKTIVNELSYPIYKRQIFPIENDETVATYTAQNMMIHLTMKSENDYT